MKHFKIKKSSIWCFLLTMPFVEPQFFKNIDSLNSIYRYASYFVVLYVIGYLLRKKRIPSKNLIVITILETILLLSTYINKGLTNVAFNSFSAIVGLAGVVFIYSDRIGKLIECLLLHFELCIYINFLSLIVFRNGLYWIDSEAYSHGTAGFFLGWNHLFIVWEIPALLIAWLYKEMYQKKTRCYVLSLVIIVSEIVFGASTGRVGVFLLLTLCILPMIKQIVTPIKGMVVAFVAMVLIVFVRAYGFLQPIIVGMLGEDMTFTGRLFVWDNALKAIINKPFLGHGMMESKEVSSMLGFGAATHCHNQILQITFLGGIVTLVMFILLYALSLKKCIMFWKYKSSQICTYAIITYTIIGITEPFEYSLMYLVLIIPFYLKFLCAEEIKTKIIKK